MHFVKNILVYVLSVFSFSVLCYCFCEGFISERFLVSESLLFICISYPPKSFDLTRKSSVIHVQGPNLKLWVEYQKQ